jgi:NAD+ kinase
VTIEIIEPDRRPVAASADTQEVRDVARVDVHEDRSRSLTMLFDEGHALDERILREQFSL